jgi:hypothetical protein
MCETGGSLTRRPNCSFVCLNLNYLAFHPEGICRLQNKQKQKHRNRPRPMLEAIT